jgi:hypothetical protein
MIIFQLGSIILQTWINVKIKNFKYKQTQTSTQAIKTTFKWFIIEIEALEGFILNALVVFILAEVSFVTNKINLMSAVETNLFPNYLYVNVYQLVNPIIIVGIGPLIYFSKHTKMKAYFKKQWIDCFS